MIVAVEGVREAPVATAAVRLAAAAAEEAPSRPPHLCRPLSRQQASTAAHEVEVEVVDVVHSAEDGAAPQRLTRHRRALEEELIEVRRALDLPRTEALVPGSFLFKFLILFCAFD